MADIVSDGMTSVWWLLTCANPAAPTAAEITAGVALHSFITPDGFDRTAADTMVDTGALDSVQDSEIPGRRKDTVTLTFKQQGDAAVPFTTFASRPSGFLVARYGVASGTAATAAQRVDVLPARAGSRQRVKSAANEVMKFSVPIAVTGPVNEAVAVV